MKLQLVEKRVEAKNTQSFFWQPEKKIDYLPGQFFYFTIPKLAFEDSKGPTRHFTISSSPTEGEIIRFTTRIRDKSGYKQSLKNLTVGTQIEGQGPNGTFILDDKEPGPHVFLAGGIGITPFRSFIKYNIDKKINTVMHLIYSNSSPELITFRKELEDWSGNFANIKVQLTVSRPQDNKSSWEGPVGRIDEQLIGEHQKSLQSPTYWIAGPPVMVDAMENILQKLKVPSNKIRTEKFTGY